MSIPKPSDSALDASPLLTESEQQQALDLLYAWWLAWDTGRVLPSRQTESFLGLFVPPQTWTRK